MPQDRRYEIISAPGYDLTPEDHTRISQILDNAAVSRLPETVVVVPRMRFEGVKQRMGAWHTSDAFSTLPNGRLYLNSTLLAKNNDIALEQTLHHELAHFNAPGNEQSEGFVGRLAGSIERESRLWGRAKDANRSVIRAMPLASSPVPALPRPPRKSGLFGLSDESLARLTGRGGWR